LVYGLWHDVYLTVGSSGVITEAICATFSLSSWSLRIWLQCAVSLNSAYVDMKQMNCPQ